MSIPLAPPPLQIPPEFAADKLKGGFFSALINTLYQLWTSVYSIRTTSKVKTVDATPTGLVRIPLVKELTMMVEARIVARRTGGTSGTLGDSAWYVLTGAYKNIGGVLTGIGVADIIGGEDQAAWGPAFSSNGTDILVVVVGAADTEITWEGTYTTYVVGA